MRTPKSYTCSECGRGDRCRGEVITLWLPGRRYVYVCRNGCAATKISQVLRQEPCSGAQVTLYLNKAAKRIAGADE